MNIPKTVERIVYPIPAEIEATIDEITNKPFASMVDVDIYLYFRDQRTNILRTRWAMGAHSLRFCKVMEQLKIHGGRRSAWERRSAAVRSWYNRRLQRLMFFTATKIDQN